MYPNFDGFFNKPLNTICIFCRSNNQVYSMAGFLNGFFTNNIEFNLLVVSACNFTGVNPPVSIKDYDLIFKFFPENPCTML